MAVRQVTAVCEAHAEQRVARLRDGQVGRQVRGRSRVRLDVGVLGAEQLLQAVPSHVLGNIDPLAAAIVALARQPFGVLVREHRTGGLEHGIAHVVLRGDQFELAPLPNRLGCDGLEQLRVLLLDR